MAWSDLKAAVAAVVKTNGNQEITGALLQSTLNSIIDQIGSNATYKGVATPSTIPGTPDGPVFYIASTQGTYANFGGFVLDGGFAVLSNVSGSWTGTKFLKIEMDAKAAHGYASNPKTLKQVDDEVIQLAGEIGDKLTISEDGTIKKDGVGVTLSEYFKKEDIFTIVGFYIKADGTLETYALSKVTPFIPLNRNTDLIIVGHESNSQRVCYFYDKFKNPISGYYTGTSSTVGRFVVPKAEFPINAVYFRANALVAQTNAKIESLSVGDVTQDYADKNTLNLYSNDTIFDKENSTGNYLEVSKYIDDIMILNPEDGAVYTVLNLSKTRVTVKKNGVIYADNTNVVGTQSEWFKVNPLGVLDGGEEIFIKYNPEITPTMAASYSNYIISKNKFYNSNDLDLQEVLQRRLYEVNTFDDAKLEITNAVKELYIQGYTPSHAYIGYISNRGEEVEVRIQNTSGTVLQIYKGVPKEVIYINEPTIKIVIAIDWSKITKEHSSLYLRSWHKLNDRCFNLAYCPIANSLLMGDAVLEEKLFSGNIVKDPLFTNVQKWLDPTQDVFAELTESNGFAEIVLDETLGVNVLRHTKFAPSPYTPSPNIKFNNLFRKNFKEGDLIRVRGKVYHDIGDRVQSNANVYFVINKTGAYPKGSDVILSSTLISLTNKTWTEFEVVTELQEDTNADNMSFRIRAGNNATVNENRSIAVTDISIEFTTKENPFPSETTKIGVMNQQQEIVKAVVNMLKSDKAFIDNLTLRSINTYAKGADVFFEKVRTLITQTEILRLKDSLRKPSMDGYHLVVREGVLYFYDNGVEHKITIE